MKNLILALENFLAKISEKHSTKHKILSETRWVVTEEIKKFLKSEKKALTKENAKIVLKAAMKEAVENYKKNEKKRNMLLISIDVDCDARHINELLANWPESDFDPQDSIRNNNSPLSPSRGASQNVEDQEEDEKEAQDHLASYWKIQARAKPRVIALAKKALPKYYLKISEAY